MVNVVKQIIKISGTYPVDQSSHDVTISPALTNLDKTLVFISFDYNDTNNHAFTFRSWELIDSTTLRLFGRGDVATGNISLNFEATIIEFTSDSTISIQHDLLSVPSGEPEGEITETISSVTPSETSLFRRGHNHNADDTTIGAEELARVRLIDSTSWGWLVDDTPDSGPTEVRVSVADWNDSGILVQRGLTTIPTDSASVTVTPPTSIDRTRSILQVSYTTTNGDFSAEADASMVRATLNSSNQIVIQRQDPDNVDALDVAWEITQFPVNNIRVQYPSISLSASTFTATTGITTVNTLSHSTITSPVTTPFGDGNGEMGDDLAGNMDNGCFTLEFDDASTIRATRGDADDTGDVDVMVIEWKVRKSEAFTVDARLAQREPFTIDAFLQTTFDKEFTIDAFLQATIDEEFTIDTFLRATIDKNFLIDALVADAFSKSILIDGLKEEIFDEDFIIDARLAQRKSFTIDARLAQRKIFDIDGKLVIRSEKTYTVDGRIVREVKTTIDAIPLRVKDEDFEIDAILLKTQDKEFLIDSFLKTEQTVVLLVDSNLQEVEIETFNVDSRLRKVIDENFTIDANTKLIKTKDFIVDASLINIFTVDFTVDAVFPQFKDFTCDSVLKGTINENFITDGLLFVFPSELIDVDVLLQEQNVSEDFTIDAILKTVNLQEFTTDAFLEQPTKTEEFTVDVIVLLIATKSFTVDCLLQKTLTKAFSVDTFSQEATIFDFTIDGLLETINTKTFTIDTFSQEANQFTFTADVFLKATKVKTLKIDGITFQVPSAVLTIDGLLSLKIIRTFEIDAKIRETKIKTYKVDSRLRLQPQKQFTIDASILQPKFETFIVDSIIVGTEKTLSVDGRLVIRKTKTFKIDSLIDPPFARNFLLDAFVKAFDTPLPFTVNARIRFVNVETITVDAIIKRLGDTLCTPTAVAFAEDFEIASEEGDLMGWLVNGGSQIELNTSSFPGVLRFQCLQSQNSGTRRATKEFQKSIDPGTLTWEFKHNHIGGCTGFATVSLIEIKETTSDVSTAETRIRYFLTTALGSGGPEALILRVSDGTTTIDSAGVIGLTDGVTYYPRIEKTPTTCTLRLFLDEARTIEDPASPLTVNTSTLDMNPINAIYAGNFGSGGSARQAREEFDDIVVQADLCPKALMDSLLQKEIEEVFIVDANVVREIKFTIDALIKRLGDNCQSGSIFFDDITTSDGWSVVNAFGTQIIIDGFIPDRIEYIDLGEVANKASKKIDQGQGGLVTVDSKRDFKLEFTYKCKGLSAISGRNTGPIIMGITEGSGQITAQERFAIRPTRNGSQEKMNIEMSDLSTTLSTSTIDVPVGVDLFYTAEKVGGQMRLSIYSDPERTTHIAGSPTPLVNVSGLDQSTYDHVGGAGESQLYLTSGEVDDIQVFADLCTIFSTDVLLKGKNDSTFTIDANIVRIERFTVSAFIKALGDNRCDFENLFEDPLTTTFGWSPEINNTTADGWGTQVIFIDDESTSSSFIDEFGNLQGFARVTMKPGGFSPSQTPIFKTKYRRKRLDSIGGLGKVKGSKIRMDLEFTLESSGGIGGTWVGLNRSGFHFDNDPNSPGLKLISSNASRLKLELTDGINSVSTSDSDFTGLGDKKFIVIDIDGNDMTLNIYNDAEHTVHFGNSPIGPVDISSINKDILDLKWLILGSNSSQSGPANPSGTAEIDQVKIFASACPQALVDAHIEFFFGVEIAVGAKIVREVKTTVDARLRGTKAFTIDASVVKVERFTVDARFLQRKEIDFIVDPITLGTIELDIDIDSQLVKARQALVDAVLTTEPSDPDFSENHMLDITPLFGGIEEKTFTIDAETVGIKSILVDAILKEVVNFTADAFLTTVPQPVVFSLTHLQDITPLFSVAQPQLLPNVDSLLKALNVEKDISIDADLVFLQSETFDVDAILIQIEKVAQYNIDTFLRAVQINSYTIDSKVVNRNTEDLISDALTLGKVLQTFDFDAVIKALGLIEQFDIDSRVVEVKQTTYILDAVLKLPGENGFCNFFPGTNTFGTGLEQFIGPVAPDHERNVELLIGQEFNLDNQQIKSATILLRASDFPNEITGDSFLEAEIWSNVSVGQQGGEVVEAISEQVLNARFDAGDLPPGVWVEQKFTFDPNTTPFLTGNHVIGIRHQVGSGVDSPEEVGVALPVISNSNVIPGSAIFRRGVNSDFVDPDTWDFLTSISKDMVIQLELVNGDEIIIGKGNQCPPVDAVLAGPPRVKFTVDAIVDDFKQLFWTADAFIKRLGVNSTCTPAPEQSEKTEVELVNNITSEDEFNGQGFSTGEWYEGQVVNLPTEIGKAFKPTKITALFGKIVFTGQPVPPAQVDAVIAINAEFGTTTETLIAQSPVGERLFDSDVPPDPNPPTNEPQKLNTWEFDPDLTPFLSDEDAFFGFRVEEDKVEDTNSGVYFAIGDNGNPGDPGTHWRRVISFPPPGSVSHPWGSPTSQPLDFGIKIVGVFQSQGIQPLPTSTNGENAGAVCLAIDGCLDGVPQISFTLNAILIPSPKTFTIDGIRLKTPGKVFSVDSIILADNQKVFIIDGKPAKFGQERPFQPDAIIIQKDNIETLIVDAITPKLNILKPFRIDALLGIPESKFFIVDGFAMRSAKSNFLICSALLKTRTEKDFTIDASPLKALGEAIVFVDGALSIKDLEKTFEITASLAVTQPPVDFTVDAQIILENARWRVDTLLKKRQLISINLDTILTTVDQKVFLVDMVVKSFDNEEKVLVDGLITQGSQELFLTDAQLQVENTFNFLVDTALFKSDQTVDSTIGAILIQRKQSIVDALFEEKKTTTFIIDTLIGVRTKQLTINAILKGFDLEEFIKIDAKVAFKNTKTLTVGAILIKEIDFTISAFVGEVIETGLDVESVIVQNNSDLGNESTVGVGEAD